jgi:hypothetical protein
MFFLAADAEPNVLVNWIVANDIVCPDIISLGDVSVLIVQREVIPVKRRWRGAYWTGHRRSGRTCDQAGNANERNDD